jgi:hypothetical protein
MLSGGPSNVVDIRAQNICPRITVPMCTPSNHSYFSKYWTTNIDGTHAYNMCVIDRGVLVRGYTPYTLQQIFVLRRIRRNVKYYFTGIRF